MKRLTISTLVIAALVGAVLAPSPSFAADRENAASVSTTIDKVVGSDEADSLEDATKVAQARPKHVTIPPGYDYHPRRGPDKTLHDYCSKSRDKWAAADFRGSCARHDMCYEFHQGEGRRAKFRCDSTFKGHLKQECEATYHGKSRSVQRGFCITVAYGYYTVVVANTIFRG